MDSKSKIELEIIKEKIIDTLAVKRIYLFGSHANGEPTADSDFDIYVVIPDGSMRCLTAMQKIGLAIFDIQERPIDVLVGEESSFEKRRMLPTIERTIDREGVILYAGGNFRCGKSNSVY